RGSLFARLKIPLRIIVLASFRAKRRIPALFFPSPCKGEDRRRGSLFSARLISRAIQDSAPHYCPCVIQSEAQNPGSFSSPRPAMSFRAKRRIPDLSLPLAPLCHSERSAESRLFLFPSPCKGEDRRRGSLYSARF